jgi:hypothetical protein
VIENSVIHTFERYTDGDASYKDAGEDSNHLHCCLLPAEVVRIFAEAAMDFSTFVFSAKKPKLMDLSAFLRTLDFEN